MFLPDMLKLDVVEEQISPVGSASLMSVKPPWPSSTMEDATLSGLITPLVWPAARFEGTWSGGAKGGAQTSGHSVHSAVHSSTGR